MSRIAQPLEKSLATLTGGAGAVARRGLLSLLVWLASLASGVLAPNAALAQEPSTLPTSTLQIGVVLVEADGISAEAAQEIITQLGDALHRELMVDVVAGPDVTARLSFEVSDECVASIPCVEKVSAALGVEQVLFLLVVGIGDNIQVNATWTDFRSRQVATRSPIVVKVGEEMTPAFKAVATALLPNATRRPVAESVEQNQPPPSVPNTVNASRDRKPTGERRITLTTAIVAGFGAAALAGGTWLGITALRDESDLKDECRNLGCYDAASTIDSVNNKAILSDVLLAVAAGAGIAAGIMYWRSGQNEPDGLGVTVTPSEASVRLRLSF